MERTIHFLVECDKRGRQMVEQAAEQRQKAVSQMQEERQKMADSYQQQAQQRLQDYRRQAQQEQEEQFSQLRAAHLAQLEALGKNNQENREKWAAEMVSRCIGR